MIPLRWSHLKHMGRSAAHYRYHLANPIVPTDAMRLGSRVHSLVLKGERDTFITWEGGRRSGKLWDAFEIDNQDKIIMTAEQEERAQAIAAAVMGNDTAARAIFGCITEREHSWEIAGRPCQGTPDAIGPASVVDLKVTHDASPGKLPWHAKRMGWLGQLAWYDYGIFGGGASKLSLVAVEDQPPHDPGLVTVYELSPDAAELGHRTWRSHFERLRVCEDSDVWPGYSDSVVTLEVDQDFSLHIGGDDVDV